MEGSETTPDEDVNEAHPNEGEIEEAVEDVDLGDSPEDVTDDPEDSGEADN
ncbi:MAG TPA: hypothetical protein VD766_11700 [Solirubrobacterales bacterium]|nr:hypothetical protein [Solirubrobacterales bacterium]